MSVFTSFSLASLSLFLTLALTTYLLNHFISLALSLSLGFVGDQRTNFYQFVSLIAYSRVTEYAQLDTFERD